MMGILLLACYVWSPDILEDWLPPNAASSTSETKFIKGTNKSYLTGWVANAVADCFWREWPRCSVTAKFKVPPNLIHADFSSYTVYT